jgi:RimJ/RimL family protein N-acetyltransferase
MEGEMSPEVLLRDVKAADLAELFAHQQEPAANQMAAFPARDHDAFMTHWTGILADDQVIKRAILCDSQIAGNVVCFPRSGKLLLGYWLGTTFWGRGIASRAVGAFVSSITARPIHAYVAKQNIASRRVLEKCGFQVSAEIAAAAGGSGDAVDEFEYVLLP